MRRSGTTIRTKKYEKFRGVDFTTDPALVDDYRSPWAPNMVADAGGMPEKRPGWRTLKTANGAINGLYNAVFGGTRHLIAHAGTKLLRWYEGDTATQELASGLPNEKSMAVYMGGFLWIFTGNGLWRYNGSTAVRADTDAYVPTTVIAREPAGGGVPFESVNLLTGKQTVRFLADGTSTVYKLPYESLASVDDVTVDGARPQVKAGTPTTSREGVTAAVTDVETLATWLRENYDIPEDKRLEAGTVKIFCWSTPDRLEVYYDGTGDVFLDYPIAGSFEELGLEVTGFAVEDWIEFPIGQRYEADLETGTVTFDTAPPAPQAGSEDNVYITFTTSGSGAARINRCRTAVVWGVGGATDRIFAAGNQDYPNQDYVSGFKDATYWPDTGYAIIGTDETAIMGYRRLGEQLAIIKEDNGQDSTVFLRSGELTEDGEPKFPVRPCLSGAGGVSHFGFGNIGDEQLILTGAGVYALTTNNLTAEKIVQNRSYRIDPRLTQEQIAEAVTCSFDGGFLIFVGGRVYGLDGKQPKTYPVKSDTSYLYECFYWENVPARCVMKTVTEGTEALYFGTLDGNICKLNTDVDGMTRFSDDGAPITAIWSTPADDDGDPMVLKTLLKKGNAVTIKPYTRSSAKVSFRTEKDAIDWQVTEGTMDIFNWEDIDFSRFPFNANDAPAEIPFNRKVKNYKRLQIIVKNDAVNEGFGVYGIVKHYVTGNFAKR